jgi:hypothetical protein
MFFFGVSNILLNSFLGSNYLLLKTTSHARKRCECECRARMHGGWQGMTKEDCGSTNPLVRTSFFLSIRVCLTSFSLHSSYLLLRTTCYEHGRQAWEGMRRMGGLGINKPQVCLSFLFLVSNINFFSFQGSSDFLLKTTSHERECWA